MQCVMITGWSNHELFQRALHLTLSLPQNYIPHNLFPGLLISDCIHLCLVTSSVSSYFKPGFYSHSLLRSASGHGAWLANVTTMSSHFGRHSFVFSTPESGVSSQDGRQLRVSYQDGRQLRVSSQDGCQLRVSSQDGRQLRVSSQDGCQLRVSSQDGCQLRVSSQDGRQLRVSSQDGHHARASSRYGCQATVFSLRWRTSFQYLFLLLSWQWCQLLNSVYHITAKETVYELSAGPVTAKEAACATTTFAYWSHSRKCVVNAITAQ